MKMQDIEPLKQVLPVYKFAMFLHLPELPTSGSTIANARNIYPGFFDALHFTPGCNLEDVKLKEIGRNYLLRWWKITGYVELEPKTRPVCDLFILRFKAGLTGGGFVAEETPFPVQDLLPTEAYYQGHMFAPTVRGIKDKSTGSSFWYWFIQWPHFAKTPWRRQWQIVWHRRFHTSRRSTLISKPGFVAANNGAFISEGVDNNRVLKKFKVFRRCNRVVHMNHAQIDDIADSAVKIPNMITDYRLFFCCLYHSSERIYNADWGIPISSAEHPMGYVSFQSSCCIHNVVHTGQSWQDSHTDDLPY
jgi:hypothetical protein